MGQALDAGLLSLSHHFNEVLADRNERVDFLREVYPSMSISSRRAVLNLLRSNADLADDYNRFGTVPRNADIPIMSSLPGGTRTYRIWVRVTMEFRAGVGDQYPTGTRSTIVEVTQTGGLNLEDAFLGSIDSSIDRIIGSDTPYGGSHGDVYSDPRFELVAIARSNFGSN